MHHALPRPSRFAPQPLYYACKPPELVSVEQVQAFCSTVQDQDDIFIAYLHNDTGLVRQLDEAILLEGFKPGVGDPASLLGVRDDGQVDQGILDCDAFLLFIGTGQTLPVDLEDELAQAIALNKLIILVAPQPLDPDQLAQHNLADLVWAPVNLDETIRVLQALARTVSHGLTYVRLLARALAWQQAESPQQQQRCLLSLGDIQATETRLAWIKTYLGPPFEITALQQDLMAASRAAIETSEGKEYFYGRVPDIFISYSRQDQEFVRLLSRTLKYHNYRVWVDWENIPLAADWTQEVEEGIVAAHTFIFVISPDSVVSEPCRWELEQARRNNRRVIPVCCQPDYDKERLERLQLTKINYGLFLPTDSPDQLDQGALTSLLERLSTDLEDVKYYNRLFSKAHEWDAKHRPDDLLMRTSEYKEYEHWRQSRQPDHHHIELKELHPLQQGYIHASHAAITTQAARRRGQIIAGVSLAAAVFTTFSGVAFSARVGEVNALIESLTEQKELNGLITALKASKQLQQTPLASRRPELRRRTVTALHAETFNVRELNRFSVNQWGLFDVAFSPDGKQLISVGEDGAVRPWSAAYSAKGASTYRLIDGERTDEQRKHDQQVVAVDYSSDGDFFASGGYDGKVNIWSCPRSGPPPSERDERADPTVSSGAFPRLQWPGLLPSLAGSQAVDIPSLDCQWVSTLPQLHGAISANPTATRPPDTRISRLAISPGSQYLASAGFDGQVMLWRRSRQPGAVVFGQQPPTILRHDSPVYGLNFSQRQQLLATADAGGNIKIWSMADQEEKGTLALKEPVYDLAFSPDSTLVAAVTGDGAMVLWNWAKPSQIRFLAHDQAAVQVKFSPNGSILASADSEGNIKLWRVDSLRPLPSGLTPAQINDKNEPGSPLIAVLKGHQDHITQIQFSPDSRLLASASLDKTVRLWITEDGSLLDVITGHQDEVRAIAFSSLRQSDKAVPLPEPPNALKLASASRDGTIRLWRVNTAVRPLAHDNLVYDVAFRPDGQFLATGGKGSIRLWRMADQSLSRHIGYQRLSTEIYSLDYFPNAKQDLIAAGDSRGTITLWQPDVSSDRPKVFWDAHTDQLNVASKGVTVVRFSPSGQFIASGGADGHIKLWSVEDVLTQNYQPLQAIDLGKVVTSLSFSQDGTRLIVATAKPEPRQSMANAVETEESDAEGGDLRLFTLEPDSLESNHRLTEIPFPISAANRHRGDILTVSFRPQRNDEFVTGDEEGVIKIWSATPGQAPQTLTGHREGITRVVYSPDCTMLASSSRDKTVKLWRLPGHQGCASPPASRWSSLARFWPLAGEPPELISTLSRHETQVTKVAFSPINSRLLATSGFDQQVLLWELPVGLNQDALSTLVKAGCSSAQDYLAMSLHLNLLNAYGDDSDQLDSLAKVSTFCEQKLRP